MLELLFINSLLILGVYHNSGFDEDGKPKVFTWLTKIKAPWWAKKPLIECVSCMASLHSLYVYWFYCWLHNQMNLSSVFMYFMYVIALAGLNMVLNSIIRIGTMTENDVRKVVRDEFNRI